METSNLILYNEYGKAKRSKQRKIISIIDLTFTTPDIDMLDTLVIDSELTTPSDHEVLVCDQADQEGEAGSMTTSQEFMRWEVRAMSEDSRNEAAKLWHIAPAGRGILGEGSIAEKVKQEAESIKTTLTVILNSHATPLKVT